MRSLCRKSAKSILFITRMCGLTWITSRNRGLRPENGIYRKINMYSIEIFQFKTFNALQICHTDKQCSKSIEKETIFLLAKSWHLDHINMLFIHMEEYKECMGLSGMFPGIAWLCALGLLAHSKSKRYIKFFIFFPLFYIEGHIKLQQYVEKGTLTTNSKAIPVFPIKER